MKKFLPYILIFTVIVQLFAPFSVGVGKNSPRTIKENKAEAEECTILQVYWDTPYPSNTNTHRLPSYSKMTLSATTSGCNGKIVTPRVFLGTGLNKSPVLPETFYKVPDNSDGKFSITVNTGEELCTGGDCDTIVGAIHFEDGTGDGINLSTDDFNKNAAFACGSSGSSCSNDEWSVSSVSGLESSGTNSSKCKITDVLFNPHYGTKSVLEKGTVDLYINTTDCTGQYINNLNFYEGNDVVLSASGIKIDSTSKKISLNMGENGCSDNSCEVDIKFNIIDSVNNKILESFSSNSDKNKLAYACSQKDDSGNYTASKCNPNKKWSLKDDSIQQQTTSTVYYFEVKDASGKVVETSPNYNTENECGVAKNLSEAKQATDKTGYIVGDCTPKTINVPGGTNGQQNNNSFLPACNPINGYLWTGEGTFMGCVVQLFYYVLFVPTSWIFALTGVMLDTTVHYSIIDTSYRSTFVVEGWKIIRDFCNMFFIFVLLYIAFGTILKVHAVKTQEMIINVVIIGLLINFSLFATQVIIDASNILTRVFYNSSAIKITESGKNGVTENTPRLSIGENGEIPISAAIVNKLNPQNLILNGKEKISVNNDSGDTGGIGIGSWIILIVMASIVNIVGLITFLSASLIFIARVIGLWMAMIFAPLAFFSYIVPQLQDVKMVGWKKWWPDTLKMAFLAPIFVFFLYLIVMFLDVGLGFVEDNIKGASGLAYFVSMIVPFVFIMILMMKAKDIAKDMSGELGQSITKGIAAVGGIALGGAALGAATLGRGAGNLYGKIANSESAQNRFDHKIEFNKKLEKWEDDKKKGIAVGPKPEWSKYVKDVKASGGTVNRGLGARMGTALSMAQRKTNKVDESRHHTDADIKAAGFEGIKWQNMSAEQRNIVREKVRKENNSKFLDDAEKQYREDYDKDPANVGKPKLSVVDPTTGKLRDLTPEQKKDVKELAKSKAVDKFEEEIQKATKGINAFTRVFSKTNTGSYDIRKLSSINVDKNASVFTKIPVGLIAGVATGVRSGILKSSGLSNGGVKVEGKFLDDIKSVLKDSLKNIKVELPESHDHGGGKQVGHGDSGGGHH